MNAFEFHLWETKRKKEYNALFIPLHIGICGAKASR